MNTPLVFTSPVQLAAYCERAVFALGVFDGVHLGHQAVLEEAIKAAALFDAMPVVLFFEPFPLKVLCPEKAPLRLNSVLWKQHLLSGCGMKAIVQVEFTKKLAGLSPQEFVQHYFTGLPYQVKALCVGENWKFGRNNSGNVEDLKRIAEQYGIEVRSANPVVWHDEKISSSRIRQAVASGKLEDARAMLGHPFQITGIVSHGLKVATEKLQCPTVNIQNPELQLPPFGVYAARALFNGETEQFSGIAYIGDAPTVRGNSDHSIKIELHLFDFNKNVYGCNVIIDILDFLRPSISFPSLEALKEQIDKDIVECRKICSLQSHSPLDVS